MSPESPENPESSPELKTALEVAEKVNELRLTNNEITEEFLTELTNSTDSSDIAFVEQFNTLKFGLNDGGIDFLTETEVSMLQEIDLLLDGFDPLDPLNKATETINLIAETDAKVDELIDIAYDIARDEGGLGPALTLAAELEGIKSSLFELPSEDYIAAQDFNSRVEEIRSLLMPPDNWTKDEAIASGFYDPDTGLPMEGYEWVDIDSDNWRLVEKVSESGADEPTEGSTESGTDSPDTRETTATESKGRGAFEARRANLISEADDGVFTINGLNANDVKWSKFADWNADFLKGQDPNTVNVMVGEAKYTWNEEQGNWQNNEGTDYLKVYSQALTFSVVPIEVAAPEPEVVEPVTIEPEVAEQMTDAERNEKAREFTTNLLEMESEMEDLYRNFDRVWKLDEKEIDERDPVRYERELTELTDMQIATGENLNTLIIEFEELQEAGVFPEDAPTTAERDRRIVEMQDKYNDMIRITNDELQLDTENTEIHRLSRLEQRNENLDAEWKDDVMPRINRLVENVNSHMSINVDSRGLRGNNKTLTLQHKEDETVTNYNKEIKISFTQMNINDTYQRHDDISIKYRGESFLSIDAAVQRAADDFNTQLNSADTETEDAVEETEATETEATETDAPETEPAEDVTEETDAEDAPDEVATPGGVELRWNKRQRVFDDIRRLNTFKTALTDQWSTAKTLESRHSYKQKVDVNGVIHRRVKLADSDQWYDIPYLDFIEQERSPGDPVRPDRDTAAWQNRYRIGALKLTLATDTVEPSTEATDTVEPSTEATEPEPIEDVAGAAEATEAKIIELKGRDRQTIFDEIGNLSVEKNRINGWGRESNMASGNVYKQRYDDQGFVVERQVKLANTSEWLQIPYLPQVEQGIAWKFAHVAMKANNPSMYEPGRNSAEWDNRHRRGALKLTAVETEAPE